MVLVKNRARKRGLSNFKSNKITAQTIVELECPFCYRVKKVETFNPTIFIEPCECGALHHGKGITYK